MDKTVMNTDAALAEACVVSCLNSNHANMLPLLEVLRTCRTPRSYREVEDQVYEHPIMHMSHQNPHVLSQMLIDCGALEVIPVEEEPADTSVKQTLDAPDVRRAELEDQPTDHLLAITDAGSAALAGFEPAKRFFEMMEEEPEGYGAAYKEVLKCCLDGARMETIESMLRGHPALHEPKTVFAGYFVSKLESVAGIAWVEDRWVTTEAGKQMMTTL
jgi:hypothetical protein